MGTIKHDLKSSGLSEADIKRLTQWCQSRGLRVAATHADAASPAIVIEPVSSGQGWRRLTLTRCRSGYYCLADEWHGGLAEATSLSLVLDALDGGVASSTGARISVLGRIAGGRGVEAGLSRSFLFV